MTDIVVVTERVVEVVQLSNAGVQGQQGVQGPQGVPGVDGVDSAPYWYFNYTVTLTPGVPSQQNRIALDALPAENSTIMYLAYDPVGNIGSMFPLLMKTPAGTEITLQDKTDETKWGRWVTTGPVVAIPASRYVQIPISFVAKSVTALNGQAGTVFALPA